VPAHSHPLCPLCPLSGLTRICICICLSISSISSARGPGPSRRQTARHQSDTYYLNDAVYFMEQTLNKTREPRYGGEVKYGSHDGRGYEHCWSGDDSVTNSIGRLTINERVVPEMVSRMLKTAPAGADVTSWRY
jgi:hypothetical protein